MAVTATAFAAVSLAPSASAQSVGAYASGASPASAAQLIPVEPIRSAPQPRARSQSSATAAAPGTTETGWNLRWQASSQVSPPADKRAPAVARVGHTRGAAEPHSPNPVRLAAGGDFGIGDGALPPRSGAKLEADPFLDPFNDGAVAPPAATNDRTLVPTESRFVGELVAPQTTAQNEDAASGSGDPSIALPPSVTERNASEPSVLEPRQNAPGQVPNPFSPGDASRSQQRAASPSPSDVQPVVPSPEGGQLRDRNERAIDAGADTLRQRPGRRVEPSCDELRERIAARTIRKVSLDISPPFRPDVLEQDEYEQLREEFIEEQPVREWRALDGELLGSGRLVDLAFEDAIIAGEDGQELAFPIAELSEPDLAYVTSAWGLPRECQLPQVAFAQRQWLPIKMTWKASELCHKPLYFEEVNLERYGHTAGPFAQPVISTAHFFFNIAVLPYKMGIHPPNECQYALGYYRPGNCAPWIIPPVPLSLRGALAETAFIGGMVALVP